MHLGSGWGVGVLIDLPALGILFFLLWSQEAWQQWA